MFLGSSVSFIPFYVLVYQDPLWVHSWASFNAFKLSDIIVGSEEEEMSTSCGKWRILYDCNMFLCVSRGYLFFLSAQSTPPYLSGGHLTCEIAIVIFMFFQKISLLCPSSELSLILHLFLDERVAFVTQPFFVPCHWPSSQSFILTWRCCYFCGFEQVEYTS